MRLQGKTAIVTGSTKGIGKEGRRTIAIPADAATFITGSVLTVDGGWMAYGYL